MPYQHQMAMAFLAQPCKHIQDSSHLWLLKVTFSSKVNALVQEVNESCVAEELHL